MLLAGACLQWLALAGPAGEIGEIGEAAEPRQHKVGKSIWRCGNTYTDRPCHGKPLDLDDARSEAQRRMISCAPSSAIASTKGMR